MADTPNPVPEGTGDAPVRMNESELLEQLGRFDDDGALDDGDTSAEEEPAEETEPTEPGADDALEGDDEATEGEGSEDEGPEDDASEPELQDGAKAKDTKEDKLLVSRDGEKVLASELWKARDRAREFERALPQIQQTLQSVEQTKQQLAAEKQQFQSYASQIAQIAMENLPAEPDPALMDQNSGKYDPIGFLEQKHVRDIAVARFNERFSKAAQDRKAHEEQTAQEQQAALRQSAQNAIQQFARMRPELTAPEARKAFGEGVNRVAQHLRYTPQEMGQIHDPRLYEALRLADIGLRAEMGQQQDKVVKTQQQAIAAKKVVAAPPVAKPAARQSVGARDATALRGTVERLRKNPSSTEAQLAALAQFD